MNKTKANQRWVGAAKITIVTCCRMLFKDRLSDNGGSRKAKQFSSSDVSQVLECLVLGLE